jgi:hypothetical protein
MKKGFVLKLVPIVLILVIVGIVILISFLGKDGHLTKVVANIPKFINEMLGEYEKRSPAANSAYFLSDMINSYKTAYDNRLNYHCFFKYENHGRSMEEGYVSITKLNENELEMYLKTEENQDYNPFIVNGKLCVISGNSAYELSEELNSQHWFKRNGNNFLRWIGLQGTNKGRLRVNLNPTYVDILNVSIGRKGAYQLWFNDIGYNFAEYGIIMNQQICLIPINRRTHNECTILDNILSNECTNRMRHFTC